MITKEDIEKELPRSIYLRDEAWRINPNLGCPGTIPLFGLVWKISTEISEGNEIICWTLKTVFEDLSIVDDRYLFHYLEKDTKFKDWGNRLKDHIDLARKDTENCLVLALWENDWTTWTFCLGIDEKQSREYNHFIQEMKTLNAEIQFLPEELEDSLSRLIKIAKDCKLEDLKVKGIRTIDPIRWNKDQKK